MLGQTLRLLVFRPWTAGITFRHDRKDSLTVSGHEYEYEEGFYG